MPKSSSPKKEKSSGKKGSPKKGSDKKSSPKKGSDKNSKSPKVVELTPEEIRKAPITHVIFDMDGLLVNSTQCFELFVNNFITQYDQSYMPVTLKTAIANKKIEAACRKIAKTLKLPMTVPEFIEYYMHAQPGLLSGVELLPGVSRIVEYFRSNQILMAVVTDSNEESYNMKISRHKLIFDKFSHAVCFGSDPEAGNPRPAPDIYQLAASRFKENPPKAPCNVLVFEDTETGVDAAIAANMKVIWVPDSRVDTTLHNFYEHLMVIKTLNHFEPQLWRLPYYNNLYTVNY